MAPFLFFGGFLALVAVMMFFGIRSARRRQEALEAFAHANGFSFHPGKDRSHDHRYTFGCFRTGTSRYALNTILGSISALESTCDLRMGDYHYETSSGSGKNRRTTSHYFSYVIVHLPFQVPWFSLRKEGFLDSIAGAIGFDDLDFESAEFSRAFHIKCEERKFAYDLIDPRMMQFLLNNEPARIELAGDILLIRKGGRWKPEVFEQMFGFTTQFLDHFPRHLVHDRKKMPLSAI